MAEARIYYVYNEENFELQHSIMLTSKEAPENSTTVEPPEVKASEVAVFKPEAKEWEIKPDYRFTHKMVNVDLEISNIEEIGDIPEGFYLVENELAEKIEADKDLYIVDVKKGKVREKTEAEKKADRHNRLKMYSLTRLEFQNFVLEPNGITYDRLLEILATDINLRKTWDLCSRVFRGDDTLCKAIEMLLPSVTSELLDDIFEAKGKLVDNAE